MNSNRYHVILKAKLLSDICPSSLTNYILFLLLLLLYCYKSCIHSSFVEQHGVSTFTVCLRDCLEVLSKGTVSQREQEEETGIYHVTLITTDADYVCVCVSAG